jgi:hypothetical protein
LRQQGNTNGDDDWGNGVAVASAGSDDSWDNGAAVASAGGGGDWGNGAAVASGDINNGEDLGITCGDRVMMIGATELQ